MEFNQLNGSKQKALRRFTCTNEIFHIRILLVYRNSLKKSVNFLLPLRLLFLTTLMRIFTGFLVMVLCFFASSHSTAQTSCISTGLNGTTIELPCNVNCAPFQFQVPHLKSTTTYSVVNIPFSPFPFNAPGTEVTEVYIDDKFSNLISIPFPFCFYDSTYNKIVIGSNGVVTFDEINAGQNNAYTLTNGSNPQPIPYNVGSAPGGIATTYYPRASIMGAYHDIYPNASNVPPTRKIQWSVVGTAPCRKFVISYFDVPMFSCTTLICSQQIVLHESTGIVDVHLLNKPLCTTFNQGLAILGMQNWDRDEAVAAPGKNATQWTAENESYRFVPSGAGSRFAKAELLSISGTVLAETGVTPGADTATSVVGMLDLNFPQQCPTASSTQYIVRTYYSSCSNPANQIISSDTITVEKTTSLNATASAIIPSACGPNGGFTVDIPTGAGTTPYSLSLDGGAPVSTNNQSHTFTGLLGGNHSVVITTAGGCSQTLPVVIPTSGTLTINATQTGTSCNGSSDGTITLTPQNGVAPWTYTINGSPGGSFSTPSHTITGLTFGNKFISVTDASGCVLNNMLVQVAQGGPLTITTAAVPPACAGSASGTITVTPTSGTAPYTYSINNGPFQASNVFSNLVTGIWFISVQDSKGCFVNNVFVNVPASTGSLNATATATGTSCAGVNNGSINIVPANGSAPFQYSINGGTTFFNGTTITGLAPGSYSVIVKDAGGCTSQPIAATVVAGSSLLATTATTPTSCTGVNNGTITVTPTNGGPTYTYQLDGGAPQSSNVFTNVSAGAHSIVVTDAGGCVSNAIPVTVTVGPAITGTVVSTPTSCNGAVNGTLTITPTSGSTPFSYQLDGGAFVSSNIFSGLAAGNHTVVIRDAAGCSSNPISVNITAGAPLTGSAVFTPTSCNGASDGTLTLTPDNGNSPFEYSLDGTTWQSSNQFTGLAATAYTGYIRDVAGCTTASIPVTIGVGPELTATTSTTPTSCSGAVNGTITITNTNGTGPFEYSLDGTTFQSSNTFTGLATGNYTITYRNGSGCQSAVQATIQPGSPLTATVAVDHVSCYNGNTGSATISISSNGAPPYQYSLDGTTWQNSNQFTGLVAGDYTVHFRDQNQCSGTQAFTVNQPTALTFTPSEQAALCNGAGNGQVLIAAAGGTAPYQYSLDGVNYQAMNSFNVPAGNYTVYVKDQNNCIQSQQVSVGEPSSLSATSAATNASCDGGADGVITVTTSGGTSPYQYSINGVDYQASNIFYVTPGNYTVMVKDANGCTTSNNLAVGLTNNLTVAPAGDLTVCEGVGVELEPLTNATQFIWTPSQGLSATNVKKPVATPSATTDYYVQAILGVCSAYDTIRVNVLPAPVANAGPDKDICFGQTVQLTGSGGSQYIWSPDTYMNTNLAADPVVTPAQTMQYVLNVVDANGCRSLQPDMVTVNVTPPIVVKISKDTIVANGDVFQLFASSVATDYTWTPAFGLDDANKATPMVTVTGDITYTVVATTSAGCKGEASVTLRVFEGPEIYVPTAFTPNGDGKNDVFKPFPVGIKNYTYFRIYNRWGQEIFASADFNRGWDGTINGKQQPTGTYVWIVEGITKDNKKIVKRGTIIVVR